MEELLSVSDLARVLGLSRFTIYSWAAKHRLPALKVGSRLMFRPSEIEEWISGWSRQQSSSGSAGSIYPAPAQDPTSNAQENTVVSDALAPRGQSRD